VIAAHGTRAETVLHERDRDERDTVEFDRVTVDRPDAVGRQGFRKPERGVRHGATLPADAAAEQGGFTTRTGRVQRLRTVLPRGHGIIIGCRTEELPAEPAASRSASWHFSSAR